MEVNIRINCDNAAFGENTGIEIARILRKLAEQVRFSTIDDYESITIRDISGNRVGSYESQE
jgi:hypothetical protein